MSVLNEMYEELVLEDKKATSKAENESSKSAASKITSISHNNVLNCLFILTDENKLILYDCNTGSKLKTINWLELNNSQSK